jgi:signal transduction histidine kinase
MGWWRRLGLRARLMLVGTTGIVVGLAIGSIAIVAAMSYALQRTVDGEADKTADSIVAMIQQDVNAPQPLPEPLPVPAGQVAQVLDSGHHVMAGSSDADRLVPLLRPKELELALGGARIEVNGDRALRNETLRIMAVLTGPANDRRTIIVAVPVGAFDHSVALLRTALFVTQPVLVLVLIAVGWRVVGAALRPVESLRSGAERITGADTAERLAVPPSRDEIHRLAVTLNHMIDRLALARERQRAFVADAAHELRSPLASMRVQLEVAQRLGDWATLGDDLLLDVDRLSRLVDDLLLLARADEGTRAAGSDGMRMGLDARAGFDGARRLASVEPVELHDLLRDVAGRYSAARVPVTVADRPAGPLWTEGESDGLRRVLVNLVDNAVRHARSSVRLAAVADRAGALVTVTDDGLGIARPDRERVFDRFTRLDDARARDAGGAGLGLPIVRELVRRHGGTVVLEDAHPGVRAELRLPLAPAFDAL